VSDGIVPTGKGDVKDIAAELARRLSPKHLAELRASSLTDATILANGYYTERDPQKIADILNWDRPARSLGECLCIPYLDADGKPLPVIDRETGEIIRDANGEPVPFIRVKPDRPRKDKKKNGKVYKYESRRGARNHTYVPRAAWALLADPAATVIVTEGEKKACAAAQAGHACVAIPGVDNWSLPRVKGPGGVKLGPREMLPSLRDVVRGRRVTICYDADAAGNENVRRAEWALALALTEACGGVLVARLPDPGAKGIDDHIIRHGAENFGAVLAAATPPTDPKTGRTILTLECASPPTLEGGGSDGGTNNTPPPLRLAATRCLVHCPNGGGRDLLGIGARTVGRGGRRAIDCGVISSCGACLNNAKVDWVHHLVPSIRDADRPVAIWRGQRGDWPGLLAHLRRARRRHGCEPHSLVTVRRSPASEVFAVFVGAPPSDRLTTTAPQQAAAQLFESLEAVELCPDHPSRWCPVKYSADLWEEEDREPAWSVVTGAEAMELPAMRRVFARYGCELVERGGQFLVLASGNVEAAYEEMAHGPGWLRYLPWRLLGGLSLSGPGWFYADHLWSYWCSGDLPRELRPMPTADRGTVCERIDAIIPGFGRRVWDERPDDEAREILRGLTYWRLRNPDAAVLPDDYAPDEGPPAPPVADAPAPDLLDVLAEPPAPTTDSADPVLEECDRLHAQLRALAECLAPHWRAYIETRISAGPGSPENLRRALEWATRHAPRPPDRGTG
jgi:hypothetical protein